LASGDKLYSGNITAACEPTANYPTAIEEIYAVVQWVAQHGREHGLKPDTLTIAGDPMLCHPLNDRVNFLNRRRIFGFR
jgi:hypothetical protein